MAEYMTMPKMSDTMTVGTLVTWHKKVGDKVKSGDILADVQTDKATMELESYYDGTILYQAIQEGQDIPVNALLIIIGKEGEDIQPILQKFQSTQAETTPSVTKNETQTVANANATTTTITQPSLTNTQVVVEETDNGRIKASPLAKKIASENQINLKEIKGTGDGGRIIKKDVDNYLELLKTQPKTVKTSVLVTDSYEDIPLNNMRKVIAKRLTESKNNAPHFYLTMKIDMDNAIEARKKFNALSEVKISFNDILIKAVAAALKKHPKVNSSWLEDRIRVNHNINIGVAVAIEDGLVVPVIKNADLKGLTQIASEVKEFVNKAKSKGLAPEDFTGNTFTISNLGMYGIEEFTAIINPPDSCILAVGAIMEEPVIKNGQIVVGNTMRVTLSCDHRVVDGAVGSEFLQTLKSYLEDPIRMLL
jgi:pyruvate dehydrogenase E2 component (dihydrolipoamide acetyltransferase)